MGGAGSMEAKSLKDDMLADVKMGTIGRLEK
jgi:hypothetical protein